MTNLIDPGSTTSGWTFIRLEAPSRYAINAEWYQHYLKLDSYRAWLQTNCLLNTWQWQSNRIGGTSVGVYIADSEVAMMFKLKFQL